tara:strand:- start:1020 stop:1277 length:258 start_codon:yes stop_codon:yes gene_type:complete
MDRYNKNDVDYNEQERIYHVKKFKTALYGFIIFIILSTKVSYKILDIIIKIFRPSTNDIIDSNDNPMTLGIVLNAFIFSVIIFLV